MAAPYEVLAGPFTVYVAPSGTAFPDVDTTPDVNWTKLGTTGDHNYEESGVTVALAPGYSEFTPAGSTAPTKAWRVSESLKVSFNLVDMKPAQFAKLLNNATSSDLTGPARSEVALLQGHEVYLYALVCRKTGSTSGDALNTQFQVPLVYNAGQPSIVGKKGEPMALAVEFTALKDSTLGFGKYVAQTA